MTPLESLLSLLPDEPSETTIAGSLAFPLGPDSSSVAADENIPFRDDNDML